MVQHQQQTVSQPPDPTRIRAAYEKVCRVLLERKTSDGYWVGRLSASALSTATAVSALAIFCKNAKPEHLAGTPIVSGHSAPLRSRLSLNDLISHGVDWLLAHQNLDGGWGDTDKSVSNVSTTLLVKSALVLATNESRERNGVERPDQPESPVAPAIAYAPGFHSRSRLSLENADAYIQKTGGIDAIRKRYGDDQTFSVPILTNAALAGLVEWKDIPQLPFELAALPMSWFRFVKMNVVSYAVPALVAIGQVRFHFAPEKGRFIGNFFRRLVKKRTLRLIQEMQPASGGYLEAAPLTSFVVMSLSAMGQTDHPIVTNGIRFLVDTVREDGSWAIDTNLATWLTSLSLSALETADGRLQTAAEVDCRPPGGNGAEIDWLLSCQHTKRHPFTGASPGGWGWTNLSGAVPDADDTAAALLALASQRESES